MHPIQLMTNTTLYKVWPSMIKLCEATRKWPLRVSNLWPPGYQPDALTNWATGPTRVLIIDLYIPQVNRFNKIKGKTLEIKDISTSSSYFTRSYTYADIIRVTGMAISTAAVIALIYATAGGATIISETIKRKITKTISSISTSLLSNSTYIKTHGVTLEYHQYRE